MERSLCGVLRDVPVRRRLRRQPRGAEVAGFAAEGRGRRALLIDLGLLALFALQHSIMARPAFKRVLTRVVSPVVERSTYVLASSLALILLFWQWRPLGGVVWSVENQSASRRSCTRGSRSAGCSCS